MTAVVVAMRPPSLLDPNVGVDSSDDAQHYNDMFPLAVADGTKNEATKETGLIACNKT